MPERKVEQPPVLSDEDEKILDEVWDEIQREEETAAVKNPRIDRAAETFASRQKQKEDHESES
jgi:hypothetical protein